MALNIKKIFTAGFVTTVLAFPFAVDYYTSNQLQDVKVQLNKEGVDFDVLSKHGLIETKREIVFTIKDGSKVAKKTLQELKQNYPDYKELLEVFEDTEKSTWDKALEGTTFTGYITSNNYMMKQPVIQIALKKLSNELMREIRKDPNASKVILPILTNEVLSANIVVGYDSKIKKVKLKDIVETINLNRNNNMKIELLGNKMKIVDDNIIETNIDKQYFKIKDRRSSVSIETKNIKTYQDFKDTFDQKSKVSFENFNLIGLTRSKQEIISISKASMNDEITTSNNHIATSSNYDINNLSFTTNNLNIFSVYKAHLDLKLDDLEKKNLKALLNTYTKIVLPISTDDKDVVQMQLVRDILAFFNNGFKMEAHTKFDKLYVLGQVFKNVKLDLNGNLVKNSVGVNSRGDNILKYLNVDAKLVLDEDSAKQISLLSSQLNEYVGYGKDENKSKVFNISFKNSNLTVNNNTIQYN